MVTSRRWNSFAYLFEPLFRSEMRRDMFYNALGFEDGLSLARLKFIELVLTYNGAYYEHFAGYVRCRIHFALYDEVKKVWADENKKAPLPDSEAEGAEFSDDVIEREELSILLNLALNKLTAKQRQTIEALYINGYSGRETAELLNCSPAMVTKHHKQALKTYTAILRNSGFILSADLLLIKKIAVPKSTAIFIL